MLSLDGCRTTELGVALEEASHVGFGFVDDFAPHLLEPLKAISEQSPDDNWQVLEPGKRSEEILALQGVILAQTRVLDPLSNLDFMHILHRARGGSSWHYDVTPDDSAAADYTKGRFRAGYNLMGDTELGFDTPDGERRWRRIGLGTLYVMDYMHNPFHGSKAASEESASRETSKVLLMTDVASRSTFPSLR
jgi:hypothetical protein